MKSCNARVPTIELDHLLVLISNRLVANLLDLLTLYLLVEHVFSVFPGAHADPYTGQCSHQQYW